MAPALSSEVDLLIIGAGPAGLMAAAWASQYPISTRIIDKKHARVSTGQADDLQPRSVEIFDSFGMVDPVWKNGCHISEICVWKPDSTGRIQREQRVLSQSLGTSRYTQCAINQGFIEQTVLDMLKTTGKIHVERSVVPEKLMLDRSAIEREDTYPITIEIRHNVYDQGSSKVNGADRSNGGPRNRTEGAIDLTKSQEAMKSERVEIIKAKYLLGCDGGHSWTRRQVGLPLEGEQSDHIWGVIDIVPLTNFPDIRQSCAIHSTNYGSIMTVPRENRLNRLYIQLSEEGSNYDRSQISPELMLKKAQDIFKPYELDFKHCDWWSAYQIGQRIAPKFSVDQRIYLAGDAVHTHSPKLGQGMNVSLQDTYNLCWKLGSVISGHAKREILETYNTERRQVALDLLAADREIARFYSRSLKRESLAISINETDSVDFQVIRNKMYDFLAGVGVTYGPSILVAHSNDESAPVKDAHNGGPIIARQDVARKIKLGRRLQSYKLINQAEARPVQLADLLKSDGRWRIIVFAGDLTHCHQAQRMQHLGDLLAGPRSILRTYTRPNQPIDSVIEVLTIHSGPRQAVSLFDLHDVFHPYDEIMGWDYWKVFVDDVSYHEGFDDVYAKFGIDRQEGCIVVCRPDQHVGFIGALEDFNDVEKYFSRILIPQI